MPASLRISGDNITQLANEERWRDAMQRMGRSAVEAHLRRRPGRPTEAIDDVGYDPPYPPRAFCEQWCIEQDNILFRFSPRMVAIAVTLVIVMCASLLQAWSDFNGVPANSLSRGGGRASMDATASGGGPRGVGAAPSIFDIPPYQPITPTQSITPPQAFTPPVSMQQATQQQQGSQTQGIQ